MSLKRLLLFALAASLLLLAPRVLAQPQRPERGPVLLVEATGIIGPPIAHHIENAIAAAEARDAEALILQINTPGGLETSMRDIIEDILDSRVPVIGYVAPAGGRAASAGTFIMYATHVAAMAPGTNIGAATPVQIGMAPPPTPTGQDSDEKSKEAPTNGGALDRKAINDAAAFIRSLAALRGRNAEWAERAVRLGEAGSSAEAVELGVVDFIAVDIDDLMRQLDGRVVPMRAGAHTLSTQGARIERIEPSWMTQLLGVLANPNVAFLLMLVGIYGVIYEFMSPGSIGPGVIGAVCLVLGLYALNQLPLNYAGLALIGLGIAFMIAEAFTPTFGILGIVGVIAFVFGAAMLIDTDIPQYRLSWVVIVGAGLVSGGFIALAAGSPCARTGARWRPGARR
jgi:membrane-bound serine protease (ClpP class)